MTLVSRPIATSLVVCAFVLGIASVAAHGREYRDADRYAKDFALEYVSARAILERGNPYAPMRELVQAEFGVSDEFVDQRIVPGWNWHPPFKLLIAVPFALLPFSAGGVLWLLFSAVSVVLAGVLIGRRMGWRLVPSIALGMAYLATPVMQKDLSFGQVNGLLLLLLVLVWLSLGQNRDTAAGVALGFAIAVKVFPGLLLLPLLLARRRRAVIWAIGSSAVLTIIGVVAAGASNVGSLITDAGRGGFEYWNASPTNIGLWGLVNKWLTPNPWTPNVGSPWAGRVVALVLIIAVVVYVLRRRDGSFEERYWGWVLAILLVWPIVWDHYLVLALPWVTVAVARRMPSGGVHVTLLAVAAFLIVLGTPPGVAPLTGRVPAWQSVFAYQLPAYGLLLALWIDSAWRLRSSYGSHEILPPFSGAESNIP